MTLQEYKEINNSFKKTCVFRIGTGSGFLSQINYMILAMIFCLEHQIKFQLYSANPTFCNDLWKDFFVPFTRHHTDIAHSFFNHRNEIRNPYDFNVETLFEIKKFLAKTYLTQDIWTYMHPNNEILYHNQYEVDTPFIKGNVVTVSHQLIQLIWNYNAKVKSEIRNIKSSVNIKVPYAAIHIRRGDKFEEASPITLDSYFTLVDKISQQDDYPVFIASDDRRVIEEARELYPRRPIFHFNFPVLNKGFHNADFTESLTKTEQIDSIVRLLSEIEMLVNGTLFVGTFSSNIGMFVGMARNGEHIYGVEEDYKEWRVW